MDTQMIMILSSIVVLVVSLVIWYVRRPSAPAQPPPAAELKTQATKRMPSFSLGGSTRIPK